MEESRDRNKKKKKNGKEIGERERGKIWERIEM